MSTERRSTKGSLWLLLGMVGVAVAIIVWPGYAARIVGFWNVLGSNSSVDRADPEGEVDELIFAETWEFWTAPTLIADYLDLYEKEGLEVSIAKFPTGLAAKNAVLTHSADLGLVAVTPVANAALQGEDITLIATYFESDYIVKLVGRTGGTELRPKFLEGRRVGYVPGTISEIVLERMVQKYKLERDKIQLASFRPTELPYALERRDIDALVIWELFGIYAHRALGDQIQEFVDPELYKVSLHLVTRPDVIATKPEALEKFLHALERAVAILKQRPKEMRALVERELKFEPGELASSWEKLRFMVDLDKKDLLRRIRRDAQWIVDAGYARSIHASYEDYVNSRIYKDYQSGRKPNSTFKGASQ